MNSVCLLGRITKDPELRYSTGENQVAVCSFTLAVDRAGRDRGTDFIRCIAFGKTAEVIGKYITKGRQMGIAGHIQTGSYENRDGQTVYTTDVIVDRMDFVGDKSNSHGESSPAPEPEEMEIPDGFETIDDDDVPF